MEMEKTVEFCEQNSGLLVELITQGKELAEQLRKHHLNPSSSNETTQLLLLEKILSSYDQALSMLNWGALVGDSPRLLVNISPKSDVDSDPAGPKATQFSRDVNKKRKTQPRWTEQVKVCSGTGLEGPLDDGYSWRKYGQKDILGANYPRGYYRCTHRHSQGCLAIKQVQRSDQDHTIYEVTYRGRHTCSQSKPPPLLPNSNSSLFKQVLDTHQIGQSIEKKNPTPKHFNQFGNGLNRAIKTEDNFNLDSREDIFQPFSFPPASISITGGDHLGDGIFVEPNPMVENNNLFLSPTTSESNFFPMSPSPYHMDNFGMVHNAYTSESDLTDVVSAHNSVTNSPIGAGFEIAIDDALDFDQLFQLENNPQNTWLN